MSNLETQTQEYGIDYDCIYCGCTYGVKRLEQEIRRTTDGKVHVINTTRCDIWCQECGESK